MLWTIEQKSYTVEIYLRSQSFKKTIRAFKTKFNTRNALSKSVIHKWVNKFRKQGSVLNANKKSEDRRTHSGRPRSARTDANVDRVRDSVARSPKKSLRRRSQQLGMSSASVRRILVIDLKLHPYRIQIKHQLT